MLHINSITHVGLHLFSCQQKLAGMNYEINNCRSNEFFWVMICFSNENSMSIELYTEVLPLRYQASWVGCLWLILFYLSIDSEMIIATMFISIYIWLRCDYFMSIWVITNFRPTWSGRNDNGVLLWSTAMCSVVAVSVWFTCFCFTWVRQKISKH